MIYKSNVMLYWRRLETMTSFGSFSHDLVYNRNIFETSEAALFWLLKRMQV